MMLIPNRPPTGKYTNVGTDAFEAPTGKRDGKFPQIAAARNLNADAYPHLTARGKRAYIRGFRGKPLALLFEGNTLIYLYLVGMRVYLDFFDPMGISTLALGVSPVTVRPLRVLRVEDELLLPELQIAVSLKSRQIRTFSHWLMATQGKYDFDDDGTEYLELSFSSDISGFREGDIVCVDVTYSGGEASMSLPIRAIDTTHGKMLFWGKGMTVDRAYVNGSFCVSRTFPDASFLTLADRRLWALTEEGELYASVRDNFFSFRDATALAKTEKPFSVYPTLGELPLALTTLSSAPILLTPHSVVRMRDTGQGVYVPERCEKYGLGTGLERTVCVQCDTLYFCSEEGLCRYREGHTQLLYPLSVGTGAVGVVFRDSYLLYDRGVLYEYDLKTELLHIEDLNDSTVYGLVTCGSGAMAWMGATEGNGVCLCLLRGGFGSNVEYALPYLSDVTQEVCEVPFEVRFAPCLAKGTGMLVRGITVEAETAPAGELTVLASLDGEEPLEIGRVPEGVARSRGFFALPPRRCLRIVPILRGNTGATVFGIALSLRNA